MPTNSTNFSIPKPVSTDVFNLTNFNAILDAIDTNVKTALTGVGGTAKDISATDLNSLDATGFYKGSSLTTNSPAGYTKGFITHVKYDSTTAYQTFTHTDSNKIFIRTKLSNVWQPWVEIRTVDPNIGTDIWTGSLQMLSTDTITPSIPIANCPNGWCLQWGDNTGANISYTYMYKWQSLNSYTVHQQHVNTSGTGGLATKLIRVQTSGTQLQGHDFNDDGSNANRYLRAVKVF